MRYKFEQFNVVIENPTIEINERSIKIDNIDLLLSVDIILKVNTSTFGITLTDIPQNGGNWTNMNLELAVKNKLKEYLIIQ